MQRQPGANGSADGGANASGGRGVGVAAHGGISVQRLASPDSLTGDSGLAPYLDAATHKLFKPSAGDAVAFSCRVLSEDGRTLHETEPSKPRVVVLGEPLLPLGLSAALGQLALGEKARATIPIAMLELAADGQGRTHELKMLSCEGSSCRAAGQGPDTGRRAKDQTGAPAAAGYPKGDAAARAHESAPAGPAVAAGAHSARGAHAPMGGPGVAKHGGGERGTSGGRGGGGHGVERRQKRGLAGALTCCLPHKRRDGAHNLNLPEEKESAHGMHADADAPGERSADGERVGGDVERGRRHGRRGAKGGGDDEGLKLEAMLPELPAVAAIASAACADQATAAAPVAGKLDPQGNKRPAEGDGGGDVLWVPEGRVIYEIHVLAIIPGGGKLSGRPVLSEAAEQLEDLDLGAARRVDRNLRPQKRKKGVSRWISRNLSINYKSPYRGAKGFLRCLGVRQ